MNIEQYRALKAQEAEQSALAPTETATVETTPTQVIVEPENTPTEEVEIDETKPILPEKITIDGIGDVTIDELKNGYLRQSDYTKKTQEVARKSKEVEEAVTVYEHLKANPQLTQQMFQGKVVPQNLDPTQMKVIELENKLYDMMLEREIESLQGKYQDFEIREVLEMAQSKNITNLEDAYILVKSQKPNTITPQNLDELKKELRLELLQELENEKNATRSVISTGGAAVITDNEPKLSEGEKKVAKMMKLSESDYAKWRDAGQIKK